MGTTDLEARLVGPRVQTLHKQSVATIATASSNLVPEEEGIPGASLCGRKPSELKNEELKVWLKW